jgi:hypothetical protein
MPATITYTPRANAGIQTLLEGGFSQQDINQLRADIQQWVNTSYAQWTVDETNFRSFNNNTMRQQVNVNAVLTDQQEQEVSITMIEAD